VTRRVFLASFTLIEAGQEKFSQHLSIAELVNSWFVAEREGTPKSGYFRVGGDPGTNRKRGFDPEADEPPSDNLWTRRDPTFQHFSPALREYQHNSRIRLWQWLEFSATLAFVAFEPEYPDQFSTTVRQSRVAIHRKLRSSCIAADWPRRVTA
jgi:hypothetical protein